MSSAEYKAAWRASHPVQREKERAYDARYYIANREKIVKRHAHYVKNNLDKVAAFRAKRRAYQKKAIPKWADLEGIKLFYWLAKQMNRVIDHIVPLQHPLVCGLHTMDNLQMLTASENSAKHNKFIV